MNIFSKKNLVKEDLE